MSQTMTYKYFVIFVLAAVLPACSGSSLNESVADSVAGIITQAEDEAVSEPLVENESVSDELAENEAANSDNTANEPIDNSTTESVDSSNTVPVFGAPQFIVGECGSVPSATTASSNSINNPAEFFVGEPVDGQIVPGSDNNSFHVWQIALEAGNYHLVVDAWVNLDEFSAIGIELTSLATASADEELILIDSLAGLDLRSYEYLEIRNPQVLTFRVEIPFNQIHNYTLGIFENGTAVPSPTFNRCLPINSLALNTPQSVTAPGSSSREDDVFYQLELDSGEFILNASTSSAEFAAIGYQFNLLTGFGQNSRSQIITQASDAGTILTSSDTFENSFDGTVWLRLRNAFTDDSTVEFTLSDL